MRLSRIVLAASFAAVAAAAPAHAGPDPDDYVTVDVNGPITCVQPPCDQPPLLEVCVVPAGTCVEVASPF